MLMTTVEEGKQTLHISLLQPRGKIDEKPLCGLKGSKLSESSLDNLLKPDRADIGQ